MWIKASSADVYCTSARINSLSWVSIVSIVASNIHSLRERWTCGLVGRSLSVLLGSVYRYSLMILQMGCPQRYCGGWWWQRRRRRWKDKSRCEGNGSKYWYHSIQEDLCLALRLSPFPAMNSICVEMKYAINGHETMNYLIAKEINCGHRTELDVCWD